ncbi:MAG: 30S ribosomal protein S24e [Candidatus ainarchaeum sp.]|nr:30S ribosomal protein S24e [Candidatus ainarchaeum sp.]
MEISVKDRKENRLLRRAEARFEVEFEGATPSRKEVKEKLCAALNSKPELTVIGWMAQGFGKNTLSGYAKVYEDAASASVELPHAVLREKGEKKAPKKGKAKAAPAKK